MNKRIRVLLLIAITLYGFTSNLRSKVEVDIDHARVMAAQIQLLTERVNNLTKKTELIESLSIKIEEIFNKLSIQNQFEKVIETSLKLLNERLAKILDKTEQTKIVDRAVEIVEEQQETIYKPEEVLVAARKGRRPQKLNPNFA